MIEISEEVFELLKQIEQKKADYELAMKVSRTINKKRLLEK